MISASGKLQRVFRSAGQPSPVYSVALTPDDKQLVSVTENFTICKFGLETGDTVAVYDEIIEWAVSACLSPDGRYAMAGTSDGPIIAFDTVEEDVAGMFFGKSLVCNPGGRGGGGLEMLTYVFAHYFPSLPRRCAWPCPTTDN